MSLHTNAHSRRIYHSKPAQMANKLTISTFHYTLLPAASALPASPIVLNLICLRCTKCDSSHQPPTPSHSHNSTRHHLTPSVCVCVRSVSCQHRRRGRFSFVARRVCVCVQMFVCDFCSRPLSRCVCLCVCCGGDSHSVCVSFSTHQLRPRIYRVNTSYIRTSPPANGWVGNKHTGTTHTHAHIYSAERSGRVTLRI